MKNQKQNRRRGNRHLNGKSKKISSMSNYEQGLSIRKMGTLMPDAIRTKLKCTLVDGVQFTGAGEFAVSLNSIYDPFAAVGGAVQPVGWLQWQDFYSRYRVLGSTISIKFLALNATVPLYFSVFPTNFIAGTANMLDAIGQPYCRYNSLGTSTGSGKANLIAHMNVAKIWGQETIEEDDFAALFTSPPVNEAFWVINTYDVIGTTNLMYTYVITVTFDVILFNRKTMVQDSVPAISKPTVSKMFKKVVAARKYEPINKRKIITISDLLEDEEKTDYESV